LSEALGCLISVLRRGGGSICFFFLHRV